MSNTCDCPKPPGGTVTCGDNQLAICGYLNGQIVSGCFDPPKEAASINNERIRNRVVANWVLSIITGRARDERERLHPSVVKMLKSGTHEDKDTGRVIMFNLPKNLALALVADGEESAMS